MSTLTTATRLKLRNILFATDFSAAAGGAIPYLKSLAENYSSKVFALYVRPPIVNPMTQPASWEADLASAKAEDEKHQAEINQMLEGLLVSEVMIKEGDLWSNFDAAIRDNHIDLLVIGTRGRSGVAKILLGSVAEELLRRVQCPVLTVGPNSNPEGSVSPKFKQVLYATDLNPNSEKIADYAVSLSRDYGARLAVVSVVRELCTCECSGPDLISSSKAKLQKLIPPDSNSNIGPAYFVERGDPAQAILEIANILRADLIVLGAHSGERVPGAASHLPTSIAHKVIAHAECPVLTVLN